MRFYDIGWLMPVLLMYISFNMILYIVDSDRKATFSTFKQDTSSYNKFCTQSIIFNRFVIQVLYDRLREVIF